MDRWMSVALQERHRSLARALQEPRTQAHRCQAATDQRSSPRGSRQVSSTSCTLRMMASTPSSSRTARCVLSCDSNSRALRRRPLPARRLYPPRSTHPSTLGRRRRRHARPSGRRGPRGRRQPRGDGRRRPHLRVAATPAAHRDSSRAAARPGALGAAAPCRRRLSAPRARADARHGGRILRNRRRRRKLVGARPHASGDRHQLPAARRRAGSRRPPGLGDVRVRQLDRCEDAADLG